MVVPPALLGMMCGIGLYTRLLHIQLMRVVNVTLIVVGIGRLL